MTSNEKKPRDDGESGRSVTYALTALLLLGNGIPISILLWGAALKMVFEK